MKPSILIIEDNLDLAELFAISFQKHGFEVVAENTGLSGQNLALTWKPDFILLDIMMPDLDGLSILASIRDKLPNTKIIICSNLNQEKYAQDAIALGANLVLDKSVNSPEEIAGIVKKFDE